MKTEDKKESLLKEYKRVANEIGRTPRVEDIVRSSKFKAWEYRKIWKNFKDIAIECGLSPNFAGPAVKISKKELLEELKNRSEKLGCTPTREEMRLDKGSKYSTNAYRRVFGSWNNALKEANLKTNQDRYTDEQLIDEIIRVANYFGRTPSVAEFCSTSTLLNNSITIVHHFGSWNNAIKRAGLKIAQYGTLTDNEIKQKVKEVVDKN